MRFGLSFRSWLRSRIAAMHKVSITEAGRIQCIKAPAAPSIQNYTWPVHVQCPSPLYLVRPRTLVAIGNGTGYTYRTTGRVQMDYNGIPGRVGPSTHPTCVGIFHGTGCDIALK